MTANSDRTVKFQSGVIDYYRAEGRHKLPWRETRDPWQILISEMLLRKTTAAQVEEVFPHISSRSPQELANMPREELEGMLTPLGIQRERARLLQRVAEEVMERGAELLRDKSELLSLPGVGPYTANAVLCFSFGEPEPTLDRNMIRVLERVFSFRSKRSRPHTDPDFWEFATSLVPVESPNEYNWGILDLAARICRPSGPRCSECPLLQICDYCQENRSVTL